MRNCGDCGARPVQEQGSGKYFERYFEAITEWPLNRLYFRSLTTANIFKRIVDQRTVIYLVAGRDWSEERSLGDGRSP